MRILAHRANLEGPSTRENSLSAVRAALAIGFSVETDIRWSERGFYISHDPGPVSEESRAELHAALWRRSTQVIALNVKEGSHERQLIAFLEREQVDTRVLLFDMELVEKHTGGMARRFRELHPTIALAARVSDRQESVPRALSIVEASVIWLDEFDSLWASKDTVETLKAAGKTVFAVSPELHGHPLAAAILRWRHFIEWGVDGVCTDYPLMLRRVAAA